MSGRSTPELAEVEQPPAKCPRLEPANPSPSSFSKDGPGIEMDWQFGKSLPDCLGSILSKHYLCDVRFDFPGEEAASLEAHKLILAARSPVFEAMLYGPAGEKDEHPVIKIMDAHHTVFAAMLQFMYTDDTEMELETALELLHLSHKYRLPSLTERCCSYLTDHQDLENVLVHMQTAMLLDLPLFLEHCLMKVDRNAEKGLCHETFPTISQEALNLILERSSLDIPAEIDVYRAVLRWTKTRCEERNLEPIGENLRSVLSSTINLLRFSCLKATEVSQDVVQDAVLKDDELLKVLLNILNPTLPSPSFNGCKRESNIQINYLICSAYSNQQPLIVCQSFQFRTEKRKFLYGFVCKTKASMTPNPNPNLMKVEGKVALTCVSCTSGEKLEQHEFTDFCIRTAQQSKCVTVCPKTPILIETEKKYILDINFQLQLKNRQQQLDVVTIGDKSINSSTVYKFISDNIQALIFYSNEIT